MVRAIGRARGASMRGQWAGPWRGLEAPRSQSKSTGNRRELTWQVNPRNGQVIKQSTRGSQRASGRARVAVNAGESDGEDA